MKKLSWKSLIGLLPIYILLNMTGFVRIFLDDEKYAILREIYSTDPALFLWLLFSTIVVFPMTLCVYWLSNKTIFLLRGYIAAVSLFCMFQMFQDNASLFLSILGSYTALSASIRIDAQAEQNTI